MGRGAEYSRSENLMLQNSKKKFQVLLGSMACTALGLSERNSSEDFGSFLTEGAGVPQIQRECGGVGRIFGFRVQTEKSNPRDLYL
jgi:hypothetical protein